MPYATFIIPIVIFIIICVIATILFLFKKITANAYNKAFSFIVEMSAKDPEEFKNKFIEDSGTNKDYILRELKNILEIKKIKFLNQEKEGTPEQGYFYNLEIIANTKEGMDHGYTAKLKSDGKITKIVSLEKVS